MKAPQRYLQQRLTKITLVWVLVLSSCNLGFERGDDYTKHVDANVKTIDSLYTALQSRNLAPQSFNCEMQSDYSTSFKDSLCKVMQQLRIAEIVNYKGGDVQLILMDLAPNQDYGAYIEKYDDVAHDTISSKRLVHRIQNTDYYLICEKF